MSLTPIGYQFPEISGSEALGQDPDPDQGSHPDWDANWLVVDGRVRLADGREWSFRDPSLTTWEARDLASWLTAVAAGQVPATPFPSPHLAEELFLDFTEPNLGFSVAARADETVTVRMHLSLESAPPWCGLGEEQDQFAVLVQITCSPDDVARAAEQWRRESSAFPAR